MGKQTNKQTNTSKLYIILKSEQQQQQQQHSSKMTSLARSSSQRLSTFFISSNNTRFRTRTRRPHAYYVQGQRGVFSTFFSNFMGSNDDGGVENSTQSSRNSSTVTGMTSKGDIIALIAEEHNITNAQSSRIVNGVFDTIMEVSSGRMYVFVMYASAMSR